MLKMSGLVLMTNSVMWYKYRVRQVTDKIHFEQYKDFDVVLTRLSVAD